MHCFLGSSFPAPHLISDWDFKISTCFKPTLANGFLKMSDLCCSHNRVIFENCQWFSLCFSSRALIDLRVTLIQHVLETFNLGIMVGAGTGLRRCLDIAPTEKKQRRKKVKFIRVDESKIIRSVCLCVLIFEYVSFMLPSSLRARSCIHLVNVFAFVCL